MIKKYEIWNKKDNIKGQNPTYWLEKHQEFNYGDVILLKDEFGIVRYVESIVTLKTNNNIDVSLSTDEAMQKYFEIKEQEKINEEKEVLTLDNANKKISVLEAENNLQEENIATLSYEVMMLQSNGPATLSSTRQQSSKFNMIQTWYNKGFWTADMVQDAVEHRWLTQEEANEILG